MKLTGKLNVNGDYNPLIHSSLINPLERRAIALKMAIETHNANFRMKPTGGVSELGEILITAEEYLRFITNDD